MDDAAPDMVESEEQADDDPEYHWCEYVPLPPVSATVRATVCAGERAGMPSF